MNSKNSQHENRLCRYCGKPLDKNASHCGWCGIYIFQQPDDLPGNHPWIDDTLGLCGYCAKPVPLARKYCIFCGAPLHLTEERQSLIEQNRTRSLSCTILFHLDNLSEEETERFRAVLRGYRMAITDDENSLRCTFSFQYDEPSSPFTDDLFFKMIRILLIDLGNEFPKLCAEASCSYPAHVITRLNHLDDFGGYMQITLQNGKVEEDDTPII